MLILTHKTVSKSTWHHADSDPQDNVLTDPHFQAVNLQHVDIMAAGNPQVVFHHQLTLHWTSSQLQRAAISDAPLSHCNHSTHDYGTSLDLVPTAASS